MPLLNTHSLSLAARRDVYVRAGVKLPEPRCYTSLFAEKLVIENAFFHNGFVLGRVTLQFKTYPRATFRLCLSLLLIFVNFSAFLPFLFENKPLSV